ncbi:MAG: molybdopterin-dependent oxidoreductase [Phototrophicaceae bacterium]
MTKEQVQPSLLTGLIVGLLLILPLVALFYLGAQLMGLPNVPLDVFDAMVPIIPGQLLTFGIDTIVDTIIGVGLGSNVDRIAKVVEQAIGYATVAGIGAVFGLIYFTVVRYATTYRYLIGAAFGLALGSFLGWISAFSGFLAVTPSTAFLWVTLLFTAWGFALAWVYSDLAVLPPKRKVSPIAGGDPQPEAHVEQLGRREFLIRVGGASATLTLVGAGVGLALGGEPATPSPTETAVNVAAGELPNANDPLQPVIGQRPEYTPVAQHYRIDIASRPIEIDAATWVLPFSGLVAQERSFTLEELMAYPATEQYVTLQCISNRIGGNLISTTKWTGVPVKTILEELEIQPAGQWLRIGSDDGFFEYLSIEQVMSDERIMFTYHWDDMPLPARNGFPLRVYIPDHYGMKQPKWIRSVEVVEADEEGYWVRRGWSYAAVMNTSSVVDAIGTDEIYADDSGQVFVPVGGYAIAGARGISRVEVRVDGGDWVDAQLRAPLSDKTWVYWRYEYPFSEGRHNFEVRCYEADGTPQPAETRDVRPDGATGIHSANALLTNTL